jgi:hypothetical protein
MRAQAHVPAPAATAAGPSAPAGRGCAHKQGVSHADPPQCMRAHTYCSCASCCAVWASTSACVGVNGPSRVRASACASTTAGWYTDGSGGGGGGGRARGAGTGAVVGDEDEDAGACAERKGRGGTSASAGRAGGCDNAGGASGRACRDDDDDSNGDGDGCGRGRGGGKGRGKGGAERVADGGGRARDSVRTTANNARARNATMFFVCVSRHNDMHHVCMYTGPWVLARGRAWVWPGAAGTRTRSTGWWGRRRAAGRARGRRSCAAAPPSSRPARPAALAAAPAQTARVLPQPATAPPPPAPAMSAQVPSRTTTGDARTHKDHRPRGRRGQGRRDGVRARA